MHYVHSICFVITDLISLTITCIIHMCYKCLACDSKMASIWLPTEQPTVFILESSGLTTALPTKLPTISAYERNGQPYLQGKFPMGSPLRYPLSRLLFPCMEVVGSLIFVAKFPWAANYTAVRAAHFFIFGSSGLSTVSIYRSSWQPKLHGKIPMSSPWAANSSAH